MAELYGSQKPKIHGNLIVTADEARGRALNAGRIKAEEELRPVFNEIIKASNDGKFNVEYSQKLSGVAIVRLTELGYNLSEINAKNAETGYIISWEVKLPG